MPLLLQFFDSPAGTLLLGAADGAVVLCDWKNGRRRTETDRRLAAAFGNTAQHGSPLLSKLRSQLEEYFAGRRRSFDLPLALRIGTPFEQMVWNALPTIPFGKTETYGALARRLGRPGAQRAVAAAVGRNPLSILLPCHRVVAAGGLGGYGGGLAAKRILLRLEQTAP